jgi:hypothetical protein
MLRKYRFASADQSNEDHCEYQKIPLISHKAAANRTDALKVLAAGGD